MTQQEFLRYKIDGSRGCLAQAFLGYLVGLAIWCILSPCVIVPLTGGGDWLGYVVLISSLIPAYIFYRRKKNDNALKRLYCSYIIDSGMTSLDEVASKAGLPYQEVFSDVCKMASKGFFGQCRIEGEEHRIVFLNGTASQAILVTCPACGASNKINPKNGGTCEYCGAKLTVK